MNLIPIILLGAMLCEGLDPQARLDEQGLKVRDLVRIFEGCDHRIKPKSVPVLDNELSEMIKLIYQDSNLSLRERCCRYFDTLNMGVSPELSPSNGFNHTGETVERFSELVIAHGGHVDGDLIQRDLRDCIQLWLPSSTTRDPMSPEIHHKVQFPSEAKIPSLDRAQDDVSESLRAEEVVESERETANMTVGGIEAIGKLYDPMENDSSIFDRCNKYSRLAEILSDDKQLGVSMVEKIARQRGVESADAARLVNNLTHLEKYVAYGTDRDDLVLELRHCRELALKSVAMTEERETEEINHIHGRQKQVEPRVEHIGDLRERFYDEAFRLVTVLTRCMETITDHKYGMLKDDSEREKWLESIADMKLKLEEAPKSIPASFGNFLAREQSDAQHIKHCSELMESVEELERSGLVNETAITDWDIMIKSILEYGANKYSCPATVQKFLQDKSRCATSDLRSRFVKQALQLVRANTREATEAARHVMRITINVCQRGNVPVPGWFVKLYNSSLGFMPILFDRVT